MSQRMKNTLIALTFLSAYLIVGSIDYQSEQCSWNGCGDARYEADQNG